MSFSARFILSLLLTNWIYQEILIFQPEMEPLFERFAKAVAIPTHDKWPEIIEKSELPRSTRVAELLSGQIIPASLKSSDAAVPSVGTGGFTLARF